MPVLLASVWASSTDRNKKRSSHAATNYSSVTEHCQKSWHWVRLSCVFMGELLNIVGYRRYWAANILNLKRKKHLFCYVFILKSRRRRRSGGEATTGNWWYQKCTWALQNVFKVSRSYFSALPFLFFSRSDSPLKTRSLWNSVWTDYKLQCLQSKIMQGLGSWDVSFLLCQIQLIALSTACSLLIKIIYLSVVCTLSLLYLLAVAGRFFRQYNRAQRSSFRFHYFLSFDIASLSLLQR